MRRPDDKEPVDLGARPAPDAGANTPAHEPQPTEEDRRLNRDPRGGGFRDYSAEEENGGR